VELAYLLHVGLIGTSALFTVTLFGEYFVTIKTIWQIWLAEQINYT